MFVGTCWGKLGFLSSGSFDASLLVVDVVIVSLIRFAVYILYHRSCSVLFCSVVLCCDVCVYNYRKKRKRKRKQASPASVPPFFRQSHRKGPSGHQTTTTIIINISQPISENVDIVHPSLHSLHRSPTPSLSPSHSLPTRTSRRHEPTTDISPVFPPPDLGGLSIRTMRASLSFFFS